MRYLFMFAVLIFGSSCKQQTVSVSKKCRNSKFCVHAQMPLMNQSYSGLARKISSFTNNPNITRDTGWCAPVATTMALAAEKLNAPRGVRHPSYIAVTPSYYRRMDARKSGRDFKAGTGNRAVLYSSSIYQVGQLLQTRWGERRNSFI